MVPAARHPVRGPLRWAGGAAAAPSGRPQSEGPGLRLVGGFFEQIPIQTMPCTLPPMRKGSCQFSVEESAQHAFFSSAEEQFK